jgi:hypothetical protein
VQKDQARANAGLHPLPPLHTTLTLEQESFSPRKATELNVTVQLEAELTERGVLQLALVNEERKRRWRLDFNLRKPLEAIASESKAESLGVSPQALQQGIERITLFYGKGQALDPKAHVKALLRDLERLFGQERNHWSLVLLRSLWPALYPGITRRGRSLAHENSWLYLAGFVLRPGYGTELDPWRMTQLWECFALGLTHKKEKSAQSNWWMMWRRTAGGLSSEQQQQLFHAALPQFQKSSAEFAEGTRLLGALERIPLALKLEFAALLLNAVLKGKAANQPHIFWALARVLSRVPLYTSADSVIPASMVEEYFSQGEPIAENEKR